MINKILDGICEAISGEFGADYEIYTEEIKQGLKEPCFFVQCLNPGNDLFLGQRYERYNQFMVQYFPSTKEPNTECFHTLDVLFDCLELIEFDGDLIRGSKMQGEIVDGVLNFTVNYHFFTDRVNESEYFMDSYEANSEVERD